MTSRIRRVQHAEAIDARGDVEVRARRAVDENRLAEETVHAIGVGGGVIAGASVLQHDRQLARPRDELERRTQAVLVRIVDLEHPEEAPVRLPAREAVRMRVIPVEPAAIAYRKVVRVALTGCSELDAGPIVVRVDRETVPMNDRRLAQAVLERDLHALTRAQHQGRIDIFLAVDVREVRLTEASGCRGRSG